MESRVIVSNPDTTKNFCTHVDDFISENFKNTIVKRDLINTENCEKTNDIEINNVDKVNEMNLKNVNICENNLHGIKKQNAVNAKTDFNHANAHDLIEANAENTDNADILRAADVNADNTKYVNANNISVMSKNIEAFDLISTDTDDFIDAGVQDAKNFAMVTENITETKNTIKGEVRTMSKMMANLFGKVDVSKKCVDILNSFVCDNFNVDFCVFEIIDDFGHETKNCEINVREITSDLFFVIFKTFENIFEDAIGKLRTFVENFENVIFDFDYFENGFWKQVDLRLSRESRTTNIILEY